MNKGVSKMFSIEDGSLAVEKNGRTWDAVSNPRKYKAFVGISNSLNSYNKCITSQTGKRAD
jgi:hypothetical protein